MNLLNWLGSLQLLASSGCGRWKSDKCNKIGNSRRGLNQAWRVRYGMRHSERFLALASLRQKLVVLLLLYKRHPQYKQQQQQQQLPSTDSDLDWLYQTTPTSTSTAATWSRRQARLNLSRRRLVFPLWLHLDRSLKSRLTFVQVGQSS